MMRLSEIRKQNQIAVLITLVCIVSFTPCSQAWQQLQLRGGAVLGNATTEKGTFVNTEVITDGYYFSEFLITNWLKLSLRDRFEGLFHLQGSVKTLDAVTSASELRPFAEKKIPSSNDGTLGLQVRTHGLFTLSQRLFSFFESVPLYIENDPEVAPFYDYYDSTGLSEFRLKRLSQSFTHLSYAIPLSNTNIKADFILQKKKSQVLQRYYSDASGLYDSLAQTSEGSTTDLWTKINMDHHFENGFYTGAEAFTKNSLSNRTLYDIYRYRGYIGDTHEFFSANKFTWSLGGLWYQSEIMAQKNYSTKLGTELYVRDVWMFTYGWFVKGTYTARFANRLFKHRYEGSLRYATRSESSFEVGYYANQGGVFPTQGPYLRCKVNFTDNLIMNLNSKMIYEGPDQHIGEVSLLKWNFDPEVSFLVNDAIETFAGVDFAYYNQSVVSSFPQRAAFYLGIRTVVP